MDHSAVVEQVEGWRTPSAVTALVAAHTARLGMTVFAIGTVFLLDANAPPRFSKTRWPSDCFEAYGEEGL